MGISQVPPVPTPTAKGEIVVGTATGPTKITAPTAANQGILTDSTTASGLKFGITGLTAVHQFAPGDTAPTTITGYTYTSPNNVYTANGHRFLPGHRVITNGIVQNGTAASPGRNSQVTATSGSSTFTFNIGATAPGTYVSGGLATFNISGNPSIAKYVNGVYFIGTKYASYWYSTDAINWTYGQVPCYEGSIVGFDYDGTTYAVGISLPGNTGNGIYTSTTLASNSWTLRAGFGTNFYLADLKWCGGSVNRWVAVGSTDTQYNGTSARIDTAPAGATTWTNQTITGNNTAAAKSIGFDGSSTILVFSDSQGPFVSTSGGSGFVGYAANVTTNPSSNVANQAFLQGISPGWGIWNPVTSRWLTVNLSTGSPWMTRGMSTTGAVSAPWNRTIPQSFWTSQWHSVQDTTDGGNMRNPMIYDSATQTFKVYSLEGTNFQVYSYSATPTVLNTHQEVYPLVGIQTSVNMPSLAIRTSPGISTFNTGLYTAIFGNNKWVVLSQLVDGSGSGNYIISTLS